MLKSCEDYYKKKKTLFFQVSNIHVTLYAYSLHRALHVEIKNAAEETYNIYTKAREVAENFSDTNYHLFRHNCVTAVAHVLHAIDERIIEKNIFLPKTLDKKIKKQLYGIENKKASKHSKYTCFGLFKTHPREVHQTGFIEKWISMR